MNTHALPAERPRPVPLAVRLDWQHNTAIALLAHGDLDAAAKYFKESIGTRIERAFYLMTLFNRDLDTTLATPPDNLDPARLTVWRALKMNTSAIECQAACRRVMRGMA